MKVFKTAAAVLVSILVVLAGMGAASAQTGPVAAGRVPTQAAVSVQVKPASHSVGHRRVTSVSRHPDGKYRVEVSNGAVWRMVPCAEEDSRNCIWDARRSGNGHGDSFVDIGGRAFYYGRR